MRSKLFGAIVLAGSSLAAGGCNREPVPGPLDAAARDQSIVFPEDMAAPLQDLADPNDYLGLCPQCQTRGPCGPNADLANNFLPCCYSPAPECTCYPCYV
jgi:hypothetical protein